MYLQVLINADASAEKNGWGGNFFVFFIKNFFGRSFAEDRVLTKSHKLFHVIT